MRFAPVAVALACLAACGDSLPSQAHIDKVRVLGVQAAPPEVAPGEETTLRALAVEPLLPQLDGGPPSPLSYLWLACTIPAGPTSTLPCGLSADRSLGSGGTLPPPCDSAPGAPLCILGDTPSVTFRPDAAYLAGNDTTQLLITVVVDDTPGGAVGCLVDAFANNAMPQNPDHCVLTLKRLTVSKPGRTLANGTLVPPNRNPSLSGLILYDGDTPLDLAANQGLFTPDVMRRNLGAYTTDDASEPYPEVDDSGVPTGNTVYEALNLSWFSTSGGFDFNRGVFTPDNCLAQSECPTVPPATGSWNAWKSPSAADLAAQSPDGSVKFWAVLRDDRGGTSWLEGTARTR